MVLITALNAQTINKTILKPNSFEYRNCIYVYGYNQNNSNLIFKCYLFNYKLTITDSIAFDLGKHTPADFVDVTTDTIHDVISFYFQLANQKNMVSLLRCNQQLLKICTATNFDANRINALTVFEDEKFYYKNNLYTIRNVDSDTAGAQFFLTKHTVKSIDKPFEYHYNWQFAFERKNIHRATIIYADTNEVLVFVNVSMGLKKGQWLLRINASNGNLIKGTKLATKLDTRHFLYSTCAYNTVTKIVTLVGSIYDDKAINFSAKSANFTNQSKAHKLFLITIDSVGDVLSRYEKIVPLPLQTKASDALKSFHVKVTSFTKLSNNSYAIWLDIYEMTQPNLLCYYTSWQIALIPNDVDYELKLSKLCTATKALPKLISFENGDAYGKFYLKDISEYDKFKYKNTKNSVLLKADLDDLNNTYFVIKKTEILSATKTYNYVFTGQKGLENKIILKAEQGQKSNLFFTNKFNYISFLTAITNDAFELKTTILQ